MSWDSALLFELFAFECYVMCCFVCHTELYYFFSTFSSLYYIVRLCANVTRCSLVRHTPNDSNIMNVLTLCDHVVPLSFTHILLAVVLSILYRIDLFFVSFSFFLFFFSIRNSIVQYAQCAHYKRSTLDTGYGSRERCKYNGLNINL